MRFLGVFAGAVPMRSYFSLRTAGRLVGVGGLAGMVQAGVRRKVPR